MIALPRWLDKEDSTPNDGAKKNGVKGRERILCALDNCYSFSFLVLHVFYNDFPLLYWYIVVYVERNKRILISWVFF